MSTESDTCTRTGKQYPLAKSTGLRDITNIAYRTDDVIRTKTKSEKKKKKQTKCKDKFPLWEDLEHKSQNVKSSGSDNPLNYPMSPVKSKVSNGSRPTKTMVNMQVRLYDNADKTRRSFIKQHKAKKPIRIYKSPDSTPPVLTVMKQTKLKRALSPVDQTPIPFKTIASNTPSERTCGKQGCKSLDTMALNRVLLPVVQIPDRFHTVTKQTYSRRRSSDERFCLSLTGADNCFPVKNLTQPLPDTTAEDWIFNQSPIACQTAKLWIREDTKKKS
eukprot:CFRG0838T1